MINMTDIYDPTSIVQKQTIADALNDYISQLTESIRHEIYYHLGICLVGIITIAVYSWRNHDRMTENEKNLVVWLAIFFGVMSVIDIYLLTVKIK